MRKKYIYLNREYAKESIVNIFEISYIPIENYKKKYNGHAIEYCGDYLPHYITYDEDNDLVREATLKEKIERGNIKLTDNQILIENEIINIDPQKQFIFQGEIVNAPDDNCVYKRENNRWIIDVKATAEKKYVIQTEIANLELEIEKNNKKIIIFNNNNFSIERLQFDIRRLEDKKNKIYEIYGDLLFKEKL